MAASPHPANLEPFHGATDAEGAVAIGAARSPRAFPPRLQFAGRLARVQPSEAAIAARRAA
eukprot:9052756-Alexandrium_andersonii.AAC.1